MMQMQSNLGSKRAGGDDDSNSGGLTLDMIYEVLIRLPAKALQFWCVYKAWRALTSDPAFVAAQRSHAGRLIVAMFGSWPDYELRVMDMRGNVLRVFDVGGRGRPSLAPTQLDLIFVDRAERGATIIDPASGRNFTIVGTNNPWWSYALSSDYSFGRAAMSKDYKVLRLFASACWQWHGHKKWCEVATIMDGCAVSTWRQRPWGPFDDTTFSCQHKATVNGVLYFLPNGSPYPSCHPVNHIVAFDLDTEEWRPEAIKCPPLECKEEDAWNIALTELKGTLCVVQNIQHLASWCGHYVNLWLLMDPNKSIWVKEYRIQMPGGFFMSNKPLDVLGDGTMLLIVSSKILRSYYFLQFYNSSTEGFTDCMEMAHDFNGTMSFYAGSLLS